MVYNLIADKNWWAAQGPPKVNPMPGDGLGPAAGIKPKSHRLGALISSEP